MADEQIQKRSIAKHICIKELVSGPYEEKPGWEPNVVKVTSGNVSRVNLIGTVVSMPDGVEYKGEIRQFECTIDDGTATIVVRGFDPVYVKDEITLGSCVLIIGKPKIYQEVMYILPEIVRVVDKKWMREYEPSEEEEFAMPSSLIEIIDTLDTGEGVLVDDLKLKMGDEVEERINKLLLVGEIFEVRPGRIKVLK